MFGTALIVFREILEAALIIGVIAAATKGVPARGRWLVAGTLLGLAGSALVAASMEGIAQFADGIGQELFNAAILGVAVLMLAWHSIWMAGHGRTLAVEARTIGSAIRDGQRTLSVLLVVVAIAVLREGRRRPRRIIHTQVDEPAKQKIVLQLLDEHPLAAPGGERLQQQGAQPLVCRHALFRRR